MSTIFAVDANKKLTELVLEPYESEKALQVLLADYPNILSGDTTQDPASRHRWMLVQREARVPGEKDGKGRWSIDHLFLDQNGVPTLVEVKRASDTRIRREVVGQMLDYAANATAYWGSIRDSFRAHCQQHGRDENQAVDELLGGEGNAEDFWAAVEANLHAGRVRLVFVADEIPSELERVIEFLGEQMTRAKVIGIEVRQYVGRDKVLRILAPRLIDRSGIEAPIRAAVERPNNWEEAAKHIENDDVRTFVLSEAAKRPNSPRQRKIYYECANARRWRILANKKDANIYQEMRFKGDLAIWRKLFPNVEMRTLDGDRQLSFNLSRKAELELFSRTVDTQGSAFEFLKRGDPGDPA